MAQAGTMHFTGNPEADAFLAASPLALMIGFVLDQQVTVQKAFSSPFELSKRIGYLDAEAIAGMDPRVLEEAFCTKPALHRFPTTMAQRVQQHCAFLASEYGGDPAAVWTGARDGADLERRLLELPGIGQMKATTMIGVLAKRLGVRPTGWEAFAPTRRSLGDVDSPEALVEYQLAKRAHRSAARA